MAADDADIIIERGEGEGKILQKGKNSRVGDGGRGGGVGEGGGKRRNGPL